MSRTIVVYSVLPQRLSPADIVAAMESLGVSATFRPSSPKPKKDPTDWTGGAFIAEGYSESFINVSAYPLTPREKRSLLRKPEKSTDPAVTAVVSVAKTYYAFSLSAWPDPASIALVRAFVGVITAAGETAVYDSDVDKYVTPEDFDRRLGHTFGKRGQA